MQTVENTMRRYAVQLVFLLAVPLLVSAQSQPDTAAVAKVSVERDTPYLELRIDLDVSDGVHVYSSEDYFFKVYADTAVNLSGQKVIKPETKPFENFDGSIVDVFTGQAEIRVRYDYDGNPGDSWNLSGYIQFQGCTDTTCYPPQKEAFTFSGIIPEGAVGRSAGDVGDIEPESPYSRGLLWGILGSFVAGLLLSLTPCVYPMVGITVAIIGAKKASRSESIFLTFLYVLGLSVVYALTGVIVASLGSTASSFFRSAWVLIPIGVIFILLGLSMFDVFSLQTSSSLSLRIQGLSSRFKGSYTGIFLMGALSAFVVGPCVSGPIISLITFVATTGDIIRGFAYFFALAWGMGVLLFVAGSAAGALPKAGGWMERVKYTLGVILIWAAFYFTRPFIGETIFITASIVSLAAGLNAAGLLSMKSAVESRKGFAGIVIALLILSGTVYYTVDSLIESGHELAEDAAVVDLNEVVASSDKPVLLDFKAPWCTICKEIEETVIETEEFQRDIKKFTFVEVDFDSNPELVKKFNIIGPPAFIFLDSSGSQIGNVTVTGEELAERVREFKE
jgi:thiol:disulfide interchange protein DsbD